MRIAFAMLGCLSKGRDKRGLHVFIQLVRMSSLQGIEAGKMSAAVAAVDENVVVCVC